MRRGQVLAVQRQCGQGPGLHKRDNVLIVLDEQVQSAGRNRREIVENVDDDFLVVLGDHLHVEGRAVVAALPYLAFATTGVR